MRPWILAIPLLLAASPGAATEAAPVKLRQYQHQEGRSLKDYINEGYEIKSVIKSTGTTDHEYFLQKGTDFVFCYEENIGVAGTLIARNLPCSALTQPVPYK